MSNAHGTPKGRGIAVGRQKADQYQLNFSDIHPPLSDTQARYESDRCLFCYDAPCITACPTGINIPDFIRKLAFDNRSGAAKDILNANILGGSCARVCPVEVLCEQACVRNKEPECTPVKIGLLQRYATEPLYPLSSTNTQTHPFTRNASTGHHIAIVGAGPAGLACAHRLARWGHKVTLYDAAIKPGGLNETGIAAYKMLDDFAQREIQFILSIGGITLKYQQILGDNISIEQLSAKHDAVFIGIGLQGVNRLAVPGEGLAGVLDAVDYISQLRQCDDLATLAVGRRVVVIGGGNTAIDIAIQSKKLGAEQVSLVYRRGKTDMTATLYEQNLALSNNVSIHYWAKPSSIKGVAGEVSAIEFENTQLDAQGKLRGTDTFFSMDADVVFKATGQNFIASPLETLPVVENGRIKVDKHQQTSVAGIYAGGDCVKGLALTVEAVQHGKIAAESIHRQLTKVEASNG